MTVLGIDVDSKKVELLNSGQSYIEHVSEAGIREMVDEGSFRPPTDFSRIKEVEAVIICVPTPLNKNREPDISFILETGRIDRAVSQIGRGRFEDRRWEIEDRRNSPELRTPNSELQNNHQKLVVLESTTYPGTTDEELRAVLEEGSGMKAGMRTFTSLFLRNGKIRGTQAARSSWCQKSLAGIPRRALRRQWRFTAGL